MKLIIAKDELSFLLKFIQTAKEKLDEIEENILKLETSQEVKLINNILKPIHFIKITSAFWGLHDIKCISHEIETLGEELKRGELPASSELIEFLLKVVKILFLGLNNVVKAIEETDKEREPINVQIDDLNYHEIIDEARQIRENISTVDGPFVVYPFTFIFPPEIKNEFEQEVIEHLEKLKELLLTLDTEPSRVDCVDKLFHSLHSIKGNAEVILSRIENKKTRQKHPLFSFKILAHAAESFIHQKRNKQIQISKEEIETLLSTCEGLNTLLQDFHHDRESSFDPTELIARLQKLGGRKQADEEKTVLAPTKEGKTIKKKDNEPKVSSQVIRVPQEKLDKLMNLIGELIVSKNNFPLLSREINISYNLPDLAKRVKNAGDTISRITDELQATIMSTRMVPISNVFSRFPRLVRDLAKNMHKKIKLEIIGEETELDKTIIEIIADPLVHLIRNAVDHGIESPEERVKQGKPEEGLIQLKAYNRGQNVIIEVTDDGRGIDPKQIRVKALEKKLIDAKELEQLDDQAVCNLIFTPGFSTAQKVTEVSGRGVGMDVVKTNIEKIGGSVILDSVLGKGTTVTIRLPLTLAVSKGLEVETNGERFFIPLDYITETVKISSDSIHRYKDIEMAIIRGELLPIADLGTLLGLTRYSSCKANNSKEISLVILNINSHQIAVKVDRFYNEREFVIKPLTGPLAQIEGFSGATVTSQGKVVLVLDPLKLFQIIKSS